MSTENLDSWDSEERSPWIDNKISVEFRENRMLYLGYTWHWIKVYELWLGGFCTAVGWRSNISFHYKLRNAAGKIRSLYLSKHSYYLSRETTFSHSNCDQLVCLQCPRCLSGRLCCFVNVIHTSGMLTSINTRLEHAFNLFGLTQPAMQFVYKFVAVWTCDASASLQYITVNHNLCTYILLAQ